MTATRSFGRCLVVLLVAAVAGCGVEGQSARPSASHAAPSVLVSGLPDLGLANVQTDTADARGTVVGPEGGTVAATGADGTTFQLAIPAGAVPAGTTVALYPTRSLTGLPSGAKLSAGVQFTPEGLVLRGHAVLTITLPSGSDPAHLSAIAWRGDGERTHNAPMLVNGQTITLDVFHFSGVGVGQVPLIPLACGDDDFPCQVDRFQSIVSGDLLEPNARQLLMDDLRSFSRVVDQAWLDSQIEIGLTDTTPPNAIHEDEFAVPYEVFLRTIEIAQVLLDDPGFTVAPEVAHARANAAVFVRNWFEVENDQCQKHKADPNLSVAIDWATVAVDEAMTRAASWEIATTANRLDNETLLNDSCIQVVIDPGRHFTATAPGTQGSVELNVGFTVGGGALVIGDATHFVHVRVTYTGDSLDLLDQDATDGHISAPDIRWPDGVDPVRFDVLATFVENIDGLGVIPTKLARFDRITKHAAAASPPPTIAQETARPAGDYIKRITPTEFGVCESFDMVLGFTPGHGITLGPAGLQMVEGTESWRMISGPGSVSYHGGPEYKATFHASSTAGSVVVSATGTDAWGNRHSARYAFTIDFLAGWFAGSDPAMANDALEITPAEAFGGAIPSGTYLIRLIAQPKHAAWVLAPSGDQATTLTGDDGAGDMLDITIDDAGITGTVDGHPVTLTRTCGG